MEGLEKQCCRVPNDKLSTSQSPITNQTKNLIPNRPQCFLSPQEGPDYKTRNKKE
jgi:hypothetical protein